MSITAEQIAHIARLARIAIDDDEAAHTAEQLSRLLELIEQMNGVDTDAVEPMAHPQQDSLRLREDQANESDMREQFQPLAPAVERDLYLAPKVIEDE